MKINIEFSGGLETVFQNIRKYSIDLEAPSDGSPLNIKYLLTYMVDVLMDADSKANGGVGLFLLDGLIRPGVLILINDTDWELEGEEEYLLQEGDIILFASTLHGG
ncbi:ubiquitin-related modifier 1 [Nadsonia fulvescens var. elongata DSM 6958]|uniref:Ubiquitin-related modifier 1 n=1 Tax=Nadsonia fulvescens var. elongata DSM 6958 TaxID=857566 RepID=A0A1E3PK98_9ASCO|nr:ubiquitin-related modifier 1 [Nadsonia fulvescens var. elongata DSM 6958]